MTMLVRRPSPFDELMSLRQTMDRLFDENFERPFRLFSSGSAALMPLDVRSYTDNLVIEAALPGVRPEDVDITIEGGTVTISSDSKSEKEEKDGSYLVREIRRGSVNRSIALPEGLEPDKAQATFEHGVLTLRIPRAEKVKPHQIKITPSSNGPKVIEGQATSTEPSPSKG